MHDQDLASGPLITKFHDEHEHCIPGAFPSPRVAADHLFILFHLHYECRNDSLVQRYPTSSEATQSPIFLFNQAQYSALISRLSQKARLCSL